MGEKTKAEDQQCLKKDISSDPEGGRKGTSRGGQGGKHWKKK